VTGVDKEAERDVLPLEDLRAQARAAILSLTDEELAAVLAILEAEKAQGGTA
jgi:hypothetical protein